MATRFFPRYNANLITSRFGMRTLKGETKMHNGIDMTATNDGEVGNTDYILAHTGGTVDSVGYNSSAGNYVRIRVDSKTIMAYYHLKNPCVLKKGAFVKKGDKLGYMGKTGNATGPHLHFGIQYDGKWIDPEPYLDKDWVQPVKMVSIEVPVLQRGAKGEYVKTLQRLLTAQGYDCGISGVDGSFGGATEGALKIYQKAKGLEMDGSCGKATWTALIGGES